MSVAFVTQSEQSQQLKLYTISWLKNTMATKQTIYMHRSSVNKTQSIHQFI